MEYHFLIKTFAPQMHGADPKEPRKVTKSFRLILTADGNDKHGKWYVPGYYLRAELGPWEFWVDEPLNDDAYVDIKDPEPGHQVFMRLNWFSSFRPFIGETGDGSLYFGGRGIA